jgi:hypothetical protein
MPVLSPNWFMEAPIDAEQKHYLLLAFLKETCLKFDQRELFPSFSELRTHYETANRILSEQHALEANMPKRIKSLDPVHMKIEFEPAVPPSPSIGVILDILNKSIKILHKPLQIGQLLFDEAIQTIHIEPIGLLPMNVSEGYMLLSAAQEKKVTVFQYQVSKIHDPQEAFRVMHTTGLGTYTLSLCNHPEQVKEKLIKERPVLPNPAVFWIESSEKYPFDSTFFPVSKRRFLMELGRFGSLGEAV